MNIHGCLPANQPYNGSDPTSASKAPLSQEKMAMVAASLIFQGEMINQTAQLLYQVMQQNQMGLSPAAMRQTDEARQMLVRSVFARDQMQFNTARANRVDQAEIKDPREIAGFFYVEQTLPTNPDNQDDQQNTPFEEEEEEKSH